MPRSTSPQRAAAYFPAFLDLLDKRVVVVGGGSVATSKVRALLPCRPRPLLVVAPRISEFVRRAAEAGELEWVQREYRSGDLEGAALAFGATDVRAENARVARDARQANIPVLAVDDVPNCDFIAPALVRRGDVTVAISTGGRSPAMARRTRERLDRALPPFWGDLLEVAAAARERLGVTRTLIEPERWQSAIDGDVERLAAAGEVEEATALLVKKLERSLFEPAAEDGGGLVSLVGAGPGDPELLTLRALQCLHAADVVLYDRLVSPGVLAHAAPQAELFDVGKAPGHGGGSQAAINALLVKLGKAGKRVVRLKGGDPFVFGRGGEEALALARAGVTFEIVPGVSSALAAPAAAGIPVTHRGLSGAVTVLNGHDPEQHDWDALARVGGTLVFLMAMENLAEIAARLVRHGRSAEEPVAVVQWATTPRQRVVVATLADIAPVARGRGLAAPAVLVVGATAALARELGVRQTTPAFAVHRDVPDTTELPHDVAEKPLVTVA